MVSEHDMTVPDATPYSFCWNEPGRLEDRALELARSMAAVKCRNKYPVGVIGAEARAHYTEARHIASAIEARRAETGTGSVADESAGPQDDAQPNGGDAQNDPR